MTLIDLAGSLIQTFEGLRLTAYKDSGGVLTIGFGRTHGVTLGMTCTEQQAYQWFAEDIAPLLPLVEGLPLIKAAALLSFGYNTGTGSLKRYLVGEIVAKDGGFWIGDQPFGRKAGGQIVQGLVTRRKLEANLIEASAT